MYTIQNIDQFTESIIVIAVNCAFQIFQLEGSEIVYLFLLIYTLEFNSNQVYDLYTYYQ